MKSHREEGRGLFGSRAHIRELDDTVAQLTDEIAQLRAANAQLQDERDRLQNEMTQSGHLDLIETTRRREALEAEMVAREASATAQIAAEQAAAGRVIADLNRELDELTTRVVATRDEVLLQEAGVYEYRHPLDDAIAYQQALARLRDETKTLTRRDDGAVRGSKNWTVNGSLPTGRAMVRDFSKLMLRAYNAEADNLVRGLKPYKLASAVDRLEIPRNRGGMHYEE